MGLDLGFDDRYCRPTLWAELRMGGAGSIGAVRLSGTVERF